MEGRPQISWRGGGERPESSGTIFDSIARVLGSPMPRRQVLKVAVGGVLAAALAELGIRSAWAAETCLCQSRLYDPQEACCTPVGRQDKHHPANPAACPDRLPRSDYICEPNGCGKKGGTHWPGRFGAASFRECCDAHDCCYGTCDESKPFCDTSFLACLASSCFDAYSSILGVILLPSCLEAAAAYYDAVFYFGSSAFREAQSDSCDCCATSTCPESCAGSSCGSLPGCTGGGDCVCFTSVEGTGACVHGATPCDGAQLCSSTADCPPGYACLNTTCCGSFAVCGPLCSPLSFDAAPPSPRPIPGVPTLGSR